MIEDKMHRNLFHAAAGRQDEDDAIVQWLIRQVDDDETSSSTAERGEEKGKKKEKMKMMKGFLSKEDDKGQTPLAIACDQGGEKESLALLKAYPEACLLAMSCLRSDLVGRVIDKGPVSVTIYLSFYLSIYPSIHPSIHPSIYLIQHVCIHTYPSIGGTSRH